MRKLIAAFWYLTRFTVATMCQHGTVIHPDLLSAPNLQVFVFGGYEAEMAHIDRWDTENLTWDTLELPLELQGVCFAAVAVS